MGWYNLNLSKKFRLLKEEYNQFSAMIEIQSLVDEVLKESDNSEKNNEELYSNQNLNQKPKLFQYWHQGFGELPEVIYNCYLTVDHFLSNDFEIVRIDFDTLSDYIKLPDYIIKAREEERMTIAHFSDIIRNKLLFDYGGLWLDSSVMITSTERVRDFYGSRKVAFQNAAVFSNPKEHPVLVGSWMIWSKEANNETFGLSQKILEKYWQNNRFVSDYFLYHIIISDIIRKSPAIREEIKWHKRYYSNNSLDILFFYLNRSFNYDEIKHLFKNIGIHKLDFKAIKSSDNENLNYSILYCKNKFEKLIWRKYINE